MNARTIVVIGCLLLVAVSIELVFKELTEAPSTPQSPNRCGCIPLPSAAAQTPLPFTAQPTFPKDGVAGFDCVWKTDGSITASSADFEEVNSSYSTEGSQE